MGKEFCIKTISKSGKLPNMLVIGTLPPHIHGWLAKGRVAFGDSHYGEVLGRQNLRCLELLLEDWMVTEEHCGEMSNVDRAAYRTTLGILVYLSSLPEDYALRFSNCNRKETK